MDPSVAWFYEGQLRLHRNWKLDIYFSAQAEKNVRLHIAVRRCSDSGIYQKNTSFGGVFLYWMSLQRFSNPVAGSKLDGDRKIKGKKKRNKEKGRKRLWG